MSFLYLRNIKNKDEVEMKIELEFDNKIYCKLLSLEKLFV